MLMSRWLARLRAGLRVLFERQRKEESGPWRICERP